MTLSLMMIFDGLRVDPMVEFSRTTVPRSFAVTKSRLPFENTVLLAKKSAPSSSLKSAKSRSVESLHSMVPSMSVSPILKFGLDELMVEEFT